MQVLFENPVYLVVGSGFVTVLLAFLYYQSQDRRVLPFLGVGLLLTILPILLDTFFTTDREALRRTVSKLAAAVRQNDVPRALSFVHPDADAVYSRMENEMPIYDFSMCHVLGFRGIEFDGQDPPEATVRFTVFVNVRATRGPQGVGNRGVTLRFRKLGEDWKVVDYKHYPPQARKQVFDDEWRGRRSPNADPPRF